MFRKSVQSMKILFRYAPILSLLKLFQILLSAILAPLSIFFTQQIIDITSYIVTIENSWARLIPWLISLFLTLFFSSLGGGFLNGILHISIRRKLNIGMTPDLIEKFKRIEYACFEDKDMQDTLERMSSDPQEKIFQLFLSVTTVLECIIAVAFTAIILVQAGWWFAVGFVSLFVPMIWLDFKAIDMMNTMYNNQSTSERKMNYLAGLLSEKSSLFELKIFRATDYISEKWRRTAHDVMKERVKTTFSAVKYYIASKIIFQLWTLYFVISLLSLIINGSITIGLFTALIASSGNILSNASMLSQGVQSLRQEYLLVEHYYKFMSLPEIQEVEEKFSINSPLHIVFENVEFTYPKMDVKILKGLNFEICEGERVAIVGENGAGKSTIIKLLLRLYKPSSGRILVNGRDLQEIDKQTLRRMFSVVFQDFCKYTLTLRENVAFGDLSQINNDEALKNALKMGLAYIGLDLDTSLGRLEENGTDISEGQWQRIAIARACLPNSAFIILDEPTASLDPIAESSLYNSFGEVLKNRGCIMISHRLASAKMADKILVISGGVVAEMGSHEKLMSMEGLYARMYKSQSAWYMDNRGECT